MIECKKSSTALIAFAIAVVATLLIASSPALAEAPKITITVLDTTTGQPIAPFETITAGDQFQATVTVTNDIDCSGQFVLTALGLPTGPPEVLVQTLSFGIGPASGSDSVTGGVLTSNGTPGHPNVWKVSASCNGAKSGAFGFSHFQFTSAVPKD